MKIKIKAKSINGIPALQKMYHDSQNVDFSKLTTKEVIAVKNTEVKLISKEPYTLEFNFKKIFTLPAINSLVKKYNYEQRESIIKNTIKMINEYNTIEMDYEVV